MELWLRDRTAAGDDLTADARVEIASLGTTPSRRAPWMPYMETLRPCVVQVSGGEPLLRPDINDVVRAIKNSRVAGSPTGNPDRRSGATADP